MAIENQVPEADEKDEKEPCPVEDLSATMQVRKQYELEERENARIRQQNFVARFRRSSNRLRMPLKTLFCRLDNFPQSTSASDSMLPSNIHPQIKQVAARAQPFTAHLDFDLSNHDAENLRQVTIGKAMQLLKGFVEESVREELATGGWTAVWVKDACRCFSGHVRS